MTPLAPDFAVAPQIAPEDMPALAAQGVKIIVCNRPDGEEWGQPANADLRAAAEAAGLAFVDIPVTHAGFSHAQIEALGQVLDRQAPVLAFCRSGTRSAFLWALTRAARGDDPDDLARVAAAAGYDLSPIHGLLQTLRP
ncbi:MAG: TIGR01244 family protein [Proteobacteria bacterium SG_bin5]|nr:TIGR01244 family phosphatase [Sphingomonas sp.]OQW45192.1 MAG: TIGR01244 family protein [Proteobacteria bacterium SG_bin5]